MAWSKNYYPEELSGLEPPLRRVAVELANLLVEQGHAPEHAARIAQREALSWQAYPPRQRLEPPRRSKAA